MISSMLISNRAWFLRAEDVNEDCHGHKDSQEQNHKSTQYQTNCRIRNGMFLRLDNGTKQFALTKERKRPLFFKDLTVPCFSSDGHRLSLVSLVGLGISSRLWRNNHNIWANSVRAKNKPVKRVLFLRIRNSIENSHRQKPVKFTSMENVGLVKNNERIRWMWQISKDGFIFEMNSASTRFLREFRDLRSGCYGKKMRDSDNISACTINKVSKTAGRKHGKCLAVEETTKIPR
jgi:hypothetical protein